MLEVRENPKYQLLEGALEEMQEAINAYAEDGYRLVSLTAVRVRGSGVGTVMNEYACVLERVEGKG